MLDIRLFREQPEQIKENLKKKFRENKIADVDRIIALDKQIRDDMQITQDLRHKRNTLSQQVSVAKKAGQDATELLKEAQAIPEKIQQIESGMAIRQQELTALQMTIPNIMHESVPIGKDATENVVVKTYGTPRDINFDIKSHAEVAENLGIADFETSAKTSGNGFYYLKGDLALLNMALINFARDYMVKQNYLYVEPPLMINSKVLNGVFSAADIAQMAYKIEGEDLYLIATSEHSLIGGFIDTTVEEKDLPIKLTGYSMCFRKEIGSHGIDQKGLYRTHQFNKQEMVVLCKPEDSYKLYEEMLGHSVEIFKQLHIPIRILECCSGDLGDLKTKSADLEAWSPRKKEYFEVCSVSNLTDAQSRRLNIKYNTKEGKKLVHTLNNTVIATSRALVAILENCQNEDGSITIPEALVPYMYGKKVIKKD